MEKEGSLIFSALFFGIPALSRFVQSTQPAFLFFFFLWKSDYFVCKIFRMVKEYKPNYWVSNLFYVFPICDWYVELQIFHHRYIGVEEKKAMGARRDNEVLLQRQKGNITVPYRIIDNASKLSPDDW